MTSTPLSVEDLSKLRKWAEAWPHYSYTDTLNAIVLDILDILDALERSQPEGVEPPKAVIAAMVEKALSVTIGGEYTWAAYMRDLYRIAHSLPALSSQPDRTEEGERPIKKTMTLNLTDEEMAVLEALSEKKDLSPPKVFLQALKIYQLQDAGLHPDRPLDTPARHEVSSEGVREKIARIIDPDEWATRDRHYAGAKRVAANDDDLRSLLLSADSYVKRSLIKADAILDALSSGNGLGISSRDHDQSITGATPDGAAKGGAE